MARQMHQAIPRTPIITIISPLSGICVCLDYINTCEGVSLRRFNLRLYRFDFDENNCVANVREECSFVSFVDDDVDLSSTEFCAVRSAQRMRVSPWTGIPNLIRLGKL